MYNTLVCLTQYCIASIFCAFVRYIKLQWFSKFESHVQGYNEAIRARGKKMYKTPLKTTNEHEKKAFN